MGAEGMVTKGKILRSPDTNKKRSKNVIPCILFALTSVTLGKKLLEISAQFLTGCSGSFFERLFLVLRLRKIVP